MKWHICTTSTKNFASAWNMWCQHQLKENSLSISPPVPLSVSSAQRQRQRQTMNRLVSWLLATITRLHQRWINQLYFTFSPASVNRSVGESFIMHWMIQIMTTNKWTPQISEDSSIVHATSKSQFVNALRCMPNKKREKKERSNAATALSLQSNALTKRDMEKETYRIQIKYKIRFTARQLVRSWPRNVDKRKHIAHVHR